MSSSRFACGSAAQYRRSIFLPLQVHILVLRISLCGRRNKAVSESRAQIFKAKSRALPGIATFGFRSQEPDSTTEPPPSPNMSLPPLNPQQTASGIAIDPRTLERVVPSSRRADGRWALGYPQKEATHVLYCKCSVRKQVKIRPGFTPQEDVSRFRGSRQQALDQSALPKGHIIGWVPPSAETKPKPKANPGSLAAAAAAAAADTSGLSKSQKKNAKRAEKRAEKKAETTEIRENWDDEEEGEKGDEKETNLTVADGSGSKSSDADVDAVAKEISQLNV
jgi:partner of Y14 and mago protein